MPAMHAKLYFPGLQAMRFWAACWVLVSHTLSLGIGRPAVIFFFVLSGFLITSLLLEEKKRVGKISAGRFYLRRALRIWPLYFLIAVAGIFFFPLIPGIEQTWNRPVVYADANSVPKLLMVFLLAPNLIPVYFPEGAYLPHLWSIGVEEQYYLLCPLILIFFRKYWLVFAFLIGLKLAAAKGGDFTGYHFSLAGEEQWAHRFFCVSQFFRSSPFSCLAIGSLAAWLNAEKKNVFRKLQSKLLFSITLPTLAIVLLLDYKNRETQYWQDEIYSLLFLIVLARMITLGKRHFLERKQFNLLGNISYAMYLFHPFAIAISYAWVQKLFAFGSIPYYAMGLLVSVSLTLLLSLLSYNFYERKFLKWKQKFTTIQSIEN
jgi:peptidoglycan/LPS O-acetylase OafA/YrhL